MTDQERIDDLKRKADGYNLLLSELFIVIDELLERNERLAKTVKKLSRRKTVHESNEMPLKFDL